MPNVAGIVYARLASPDLDVQETFLLDFGMQRVERTDTKLYMRGSDADPYIHITELGEPKVLGWAYLAASNEDLAGFAQLDGASAVEAIDAPGGGKRVRLAGEPNGFAVEIVHGIAPAQPLPVRRNMVNWGEEPQRRTNEATRLGHGPAAVKRMAHTVLATTELEQTLAWYRDNLGLTCSDDVHDQESGELLMSFNRLDRGEEFVDHHVLFVMRGKISGLNHFAFEVADIDDVMTGHEYLQSKEKYDHVWGVGRHSLGDQVFDYWFDPYKRVHEHNTDNAVFNNQVPANKVTNSEDELGGQWGPPPPDFFLGYGIP
ncbi:MAG: VOC family protein [Rhodospirillales bacterium]|jgi:catechol 2,3-dioxygenase-like lactoylglutathione lyase family enzyme